MNFYLITIIILTLINIKFCFKDLNKEYINKDNSATIKGIFILIVFYSHLTGYTSYLGPHDYIMNSLIYHLGQLMVTMFLFYSGYGVYESIKNKKNYLKSFPKRRILKTWFHFAIAVLSYLILAIIIHNKYPINRILLSFIGWKSIGNSNWYIFGILCLYLITYISFFKSKNYKKSMILTWILSILLIIILSLFKESWWYNTLICYNFGMTYSFYKKKIDKFLFDKTKYIISLFITSLLFITLYKLNTGPIQHEILSCIFCLLIILLTFLVKFNDVIIKWFGENLFWIYILERIPMIVFSKLGYNIYPYKFFIISFVATILLTFIYKFFVNKLDRIIFY